MSIYNEEFEQQVLDFALLAAEFLDAEGVGGVAGLRWPVSVTLETGVARWPISLTLRRNEEIRLRIKITRTGSGEYRIA